MRLEKVTIYHNPRCSKSRQAVELLKKQNLELDIVEYLKTIPTQDTILKIIKSLDTPIEEIIRQNEEDFKNLKLEIKDLSKSELATIIANNIKILQRPIVIMNDKAIIARPIENLTRLLQND
jgi:arsenate reductase